MNKFLRILAAPVKTVATGARIAMAGRKGIAAWQHAELAEKDPSLYRSAQWWAKFFKLAFELWDTLPIPKDVKEMKFINQALVNWQPTLGGLAALFGALKMIADTPAGVFEDLQNPMILAMLGAAFAGLTGKAQNVTGGTKAATPEAAERTGA